MLYVSLTGKGSGRLSGLLALLVSALVLPGPAAAAETEPSFCESHTLHDYLAPLNRMPKLREPPFRRTGRALHVRGLEVAASGPPLAVSGGRSGYQLNWEANPKFDITMALARVNWRGKVVQRIAQRHLRLGELAPAVITEPNFALPGKPAVYRTTIVIRFPSGRKLAEFGNYYRVIRPTVHTRLGLSSGTYAPGATLFARVENPGAAFVLFGEEYMIEMLEGQLWVPAPEAPGPIPMPLYFVGPGTTSGHCTVFPIPASMPTGRYRLSQEAVIDWPLLKGQIRPMLHAEFDVAP